MKFFWVLPIFYFFASCNLAQWNQNHLIRKYKRKGIIEKSFENDEHHLHYFEGGEGETVLLIHGFGGDAQMTWNKSIQDLAKDYHVIAPDLLWFGKSSSKAQPDLNAQVDAIVNMLADRKVSKCHVVGISYGGFVSLGILYKKPELIDKLVIVDSPGFTYNAELLDELAKKQNEKRFQDIFVTLTPKDVMELFELAFYNKQHIPKGIIKDAHELYFNQNHEEMDQLLTSLPKEQDKFKAVDLTEFPPSLVIWGEFDDVFPASEGKKFAEFLGAKYVEIPDAGHAVNIENFKPFQYQLRQFLGN